jgi:NitT/TauT family transport system substrate-binding protein
MRPRSLRRLARGIGALVIGCAVTAQADAADTIRLAAQRTGTLAWELAVVRAHGLDKEFGLSLAVTELAAPEAGKIALRGGSVDAIVSDWLWVTRERRLGAPLVFAPYSSAIGAVMAPAASPVRSLADLKGRTLAVAGGPLDKSWLLLQAAMKQDGIDLRNEARLVYGAPALLADKALRGEFDAVLNYWNFCAAMEARGMRRVAGVEDVLPRLGIHGRPAMLGYVFSEAFAGRNADAVARFLAMTGKAKALLAGSDAEWQRIARLVGAADAGTLAVYRDRYREGIPRRSVADEERDAEALFRVLARVGGAELVGNAETLAPGTFHRAAAGN